MKIDLTLNVSKEKWKEVFSNEKMAAFGHVGTHYDVKNKDFSLDNIRLNGIIFDVSHVTDRDVYTSDIHADKIKERDFVIFHTGYLQNVGYGTKGYFTDHPQLSNELIDLLIEKKISILGIDSAGIRRGAEHPVIDQYCADNNIFIVENLDNLKELLLETRNKNNPFVVYTFPMKMEGLDGLPCRVVAEI